MTEALVRRNRMPPVQSQIVSIYIRNYAKKTIVVKVPPRVKVDVLKQNIKQRMKVAEEDQALFLNGNHITEQMDEIEVDNKFIFHLVNLRRVGLQRMTIIVRRIQKDSPSFKYHVKSEMKINEFMKQQLIMDYPDIQNYFLVYTGRELLPLNSFRAEFIEDNSEIMCVHKVQDRKNQFVEIRRIPVIESTIVFPSMIKKKGSQNQEVQNSEQMQEDLRVPEKQITQNENERVTQQSLQPNDQIKQGKNNEEQEIIQTPEKEKKEELQKIDTLEEEQKVEKVEQVKKPEIQENQESQKIIEENEDKEIKCQNTEEVKEKDAEQILEKSQDYDEYEEILITNKQQYSIISKNNPGKQNKNIRKKMRSNFAAPEPLRDENEEEEEPQNENQDDDEENKKAELSVSNMRDNTHLGLTVISSRHDEEESFEPNELQYRQLLTKDDNLEKQSNNNLGILRTQSEPLKFSENASSQGKYETEAVKELPNEEQKISLLEYNSNENFVVVEDVQVCQAINPPPEEPLMNYGGPQQAEDKAELEVIEDREQNNQDYDILKEEQSESHLRIAETENGQAQEIKPQNQSQERQNSEQQKKQVQKTQKTSEFIEIMQQRISEKERIPVQKSEPIKIDMGDNEIFEITDLKPTRPIDSPPRVYNDQICENQGQQQIQQEPLPENRRKNDDSQNIRGANLVEEVQEGQNEAEKTKEEKSVRKRAKSDSDSLLLDNSEDIIENDDNPFSEKFSWNNLRDMKNNEIDMSAQLQEEAMNLTQIIPGNNIKNWQKLSFSFRNNETSEFQAGDFMMLGNTYSLGLENVRDDLYAEFQEKIGEFEKVSV